MDVAGNGSLLIGTLAGSRVLLSYILHRYD